MRAINASVMKEINRHMVLDCIRRNPVSRAELSDITQLTRASITQIVDGLIQEGLVEETSSVSRNSPGRRQTQLGLVKDSLCIAAVNVGSDHYDLSVTNLSGEILWKDYGDYNMRGQETVMDEIAARLQDAVKTRLSGSPKVYGMSACVPSAMDQTFRNAWRDPRFIETTYAQLANDMHRRTGWDVHIGNISSAFALDEWYFGLGRTGIENFMVFRVDKHVGVGFIVKGSLLVGARGFSPEIGHITLVPDGTKCKCGNRGCLENYMSIPALLKDQPFSSWKNVIDSLDTDERARALFHKEAELLAFEIVNLANVLDLEKAVISGELIYGGKRTAEYINRIMDEEFAHRMGSNSVVVANEANIARIAAMPAFHAIFS